MDTKCKHCSDTWWCWDVRRVCSAVAARHSEKVHSLASNQTLIEVQLRLQHHEQLQWRLMLPVLQAELRVLQRRFTWTLLFHVCRRWQPERHILASMFWKCVWLHKIFIFLPAFWQCAYLFIWFFFYHTCKDKRESAPSSIPHQTQMGDGGECIKIRGDDHRNQGLFLI